MRNSDFRIFKTLKPTKNYDPPYRTRKLVEKKSSQVKNKKCFFKLVKKKTPQVKNKKCFFKLVKKKSSQVENKKCFFKLDKKIFPKSYRKLPKSYRKLPKATESYRVYIGVDNNHSFYTITENLPHLPPHF